MYDYIYIVITKLVICHKTIIHCSLSTAVNNQCPIMHNFSAKALKCIWNSQITPAMGSRLTSTSNIQHCFIGTRTHGCSSAVKWLWTKFVKLTSSVNREHTQRTAAMHNFCKVNYATCVKVTCGGRFYSFRYFIRQLSMYLKICSCKGCSQHIDF